MIIITNPFIPESKVRVLAPQGDMTQPFTMSWAAFKKVFASNKVVVGKLEVNPRILGEAREWQISISPLMK